MTDDPLAAVRRAKDALARELAACPDVVGIGIGRAGGRLVIKVNLRSPDAAAQVPASIRGIAIVTEVVGPIRPR